MGRQKKLKTVYGRLEATYVNFFVEYNVRTFLKPKFCLLFLRNAFSLGCFAWLIWFTWPAWFAWLTWFSWHAYFVWLAMTSLGLIWLGRLARSGVLDCLLFLSKFYRKTAITSSKSEVEHDFSKTHVPAVILKFFCQRPNFARILNP